MPGGDLPKLHSETLQQNVNLVGEPFWKPLEFVRSEANLTTPLEPLWSGALNVQELLRGYCWDLKMSCSGCSYMK